MAESNVLERLAADLEALHGKLGRARAGAEVLVMAPAMRHAVRARAGQRMMR